MHSFKNKVKTLLKDGLDPFEEGIHNFKNPTKEIDDLARERLKDCNCLVKEPIPFLRVEDNNIPELSNKMCEECGCTAPYKFRQSIKKCPKWRE